MVLWKKPFENNRQMEKMVVTSIFSISHISYPLTDKFCNLVKGQLLSNLEKNAITYNLMGESNTIVNAYTMYGHLQ